MKERRFSGPGRAGNRDDTAWLNGAIEVQRRGVVTDVDANKLYRRLGTHAFRPSGKRLSPAVPSMVKIRQMRPRKSARPAASAVR
ncbi:hypothetical protein D9M70_611360 [compost metagenome]